MSASNLPTVTCLLDDGTGTFPIDISPAVSLSAPITWGNYGRADWDTQPTPATLGLTLKNDAGWFTTGSGFGVGGFGSGPFGGLVSISKGQKIRFGLTLGATTRTCFTGRIDSLTQTFTGPAGLRSGIEILAVDALQELARRPLRSMLEQEMLLAAPAAYYTLGEAVGATSAGDTSGHGEDPLLPVMYAGTTYAFGADLALPTGITGVSISNTSTFGFFSKAGASSGFPVTPTWASPSLCLTAVFRQNGFNSASSTPTVGVHITAGTGGGSYAITFDSTGHAIFNGCTSPTVLTDGLPHVITVQAGNGLSTDLWVDGVKVSTAAVMSVTWDNGFVTINGTGVANAVTTWAHFAYGARISDAQVASIHQAAAGTLNETTDARLTRVASYAGLTATTSVPSGQLMPLQDTAGVSMLDALQAVAIAEGGVLFVDGSGALTMQGRNYRGQRLTADVTLPGKALDPNATSIVDDASQKINQATVTRSGGATQTWPVTPPADVFPTTLELVVDTDANALSHAQWVVAKHSSPAARMGAASSSNMLTSASAAALLAMEIGNRVALITMPATTTPNLGTALSAEGWTMSLQQDGSGGSWVWVLNLVPWSFYSCAVWDDAGSVWDDPGHVWAY